MGMVHAGFREGHGGEVIPAQCLDAYALLCGIAPADQDQLRPVLMFQELLANLFFAQRAIGTEVSQYGEVAQHFIGAMRLRRCRKAIAITLKRSVSVRPCMRSNSRHYSIMNSCPSKRTVPLITAPGYSSVATGVKSSDV